MRTLDIRTRVVILFSLIFGAFLFDDPRVSFGIFLTTLGLVAMSGINLPKIRHALQPLLLIFLLVMLFASLNMGNQHFQREFSQKVLFEVWPSQHWNLTLGGLCQGLTFLLRMLILVLTSMIFQQTTPFNELIQLLQKLKVPFQLSFLIVTAIRFIPVLNRKRILILEAQKARGISVPEKGAGGSFKMFLPLVIPMFAGSIQMANTLSMAMLSRGFGNTSYRQSNPLALRFQMRDRVILGIVLLLSLLGLYLRFGLKWGVL